jgi:molybdate transport repressor ModE-like protein
MVNGPDGWASLEVRHLRAFVAVAEAGSFVVAARRLGYSQPAISQQLRALERLIGRPLFVRTAGGRTGLKLTDAGVALLPRANELLSQVSQMRGAVEKGADGSSRVLSVLTVESLGVRILPRVLRNFRREHPAVRIQIAGVTSAEGSWAAVENGDADLALTVPPPAAGPFEARPIFVEPYVLLSGRRHPVRELNELEGRRLLGVCRHSGVAIEQRLLAEGIVPTAIDRFDDLWLVQTLVAAGEAVAIVPGLSVNRPERDVLAQQVAQVPPRQLVALRLRERPLTGPFDRLLQLVTDACTSLSSAEPALG